MKTSFYFVLWIAIYPLLNLIPSPIVHNYSFFVALLVVFGLSYLLNKSFSETFSYARCVQSFPILEEVYNGNAEAFKKYLRRNMVIEFITSLYFCVATAMIVVMAFSNFTSSLLELFIFGAFTIGVLSTSVKYYNAYRQLRENPTQETCADILVSTFHVDFYAYSQARATTPYNRIYPPRPRYYSVYILFSVIFAVLAILFGICVLVLGVLAFWGTSSLAGTSVASIYFLYGSLAIYYGIKDLITKER